MLDVLIVGGGPAGLSAALLLGRCRRSVLLCDHGAPRNAATSALHGYLTRDGIDPLDFLRLARSELTPYEVELLDLEVLSVVPHGRHFTARLSDGSLRDARRLLLATGVRDILPDLPDVTRFYGRSIHHCPYCDGWQWRDARIAVYGEGESLHALACRLLGWSREIIAITNGSEDLEETLRSDLTERGIELRTERVMALEGEEGMLRAIRFDGGERLELDALFFTTGQVKASALARELGCRMGEGGTIWVGEDECSSVPGVYVAGDASRDAQMVIVAAAEGAKAAVAINEALLREDGLVSRPA